jgi:hypothetical protein
MLKAPRPARVTIKTGRARMKWERNEAKPGAMAGFK